MINFHGLRRPSHYEVGRFLRSGLAQKRRRLRVTRIIITDTTTTATAVGSHLAPQLSVDSSADFALGSGESLQTLWAVWSEP